MRSLRRILKIKWSDVMEEKITNVSVRKNFNNIRNIDSLIAKRRFLFLGKIMRLPTTKIPSRLISTFFPNKRPLGRPNYTIRHSMLNDIKKIIHTVDKYGSFHTQAHIAHNELVWSILVNNIGLDDPQPCNKNRLPHLNHLLSNHLLLNLRCLILRLLAVLLLLEIRTPVSVSGLGNYSKYLKSIPVLRNVMLEKRTCF